MTVIENIDVVMGARTGELDAAIAKEIKSLRNLETQSGISAGAFSPLGSQAKGFMSSVAGMVPGLSSGIGAASSSMASLGAAGVALGPIAVGVGAVVGGFVALNHVMGQVSKEMLVIDSLSDSAKKLGSSFSDLSVARQSLGQTSGLDAGGVDSALQKMSLGLSEAAATGTGDVSDRMKMIGIDAGEALKKGPLDAFKQISEATMQLKNPTDQLAVAYELFGRQGAALVLSLREGPAEIERMERLSTSLGMNLSDAQAEQVGAANDAWEEMGMIATGAYRQIAAEVSPVIQVIAQSVTDVGASFGGWQGSLTSVVDTGAYFSGVMFDTYELVNLSYSVLRRIATLDFSGAGDDIKNAMDFGTGQNFVDKLDKARAEAAEKANSKGDSGSDSMVAKYEREKEALKKLTETKKEANKLADKQREDEEKKGQQIADQIQSMKEANEAIREGNRLRALAFNFNNGDKYTREKIAREENSPQFSSALKTGAKVDLNVNESDLANKMKLGRETMGSSNQAIDKILAEKKMLEQEKADQQKAADLKKDSRKPEENLRDSLKELTRLRSNGMIDEKTWKAQAKKAEESAGFKDPAKTGAVSAQAGSVAAYKLLMERDSEAVKTQKQIERINETQLEVLREMNTNLAGFKPMKAAR